MKKVLTLFMALILLLSCFTVMASAQDYPVNDVYVLDGWSDEANNGADNTLELNTTLSPDGKPVVSKTYTKPFYVSWGSNPPADGYDQIVFSYKFGKPYDISGIYDTGYLSLEVYATNINVLAKRFIVELTSSGTKDTNENNNNGAAINNNITDLGGKWYRVDIPLSTFSKEAGGGLEKTACNYFRMFYDGGNSDPYTYDGEFTFAVRSIGFSTGAEGGASEFGKYFEVYSLDGTASSGWSGLFMASGSTKKDGQNVAMMTNNNSVTHTYTAITQNTTDATTAKFYYNWGGNSGTNYLTDIKDQKYFVAEIYSTLDKDALWANNFTVEVRGASGGRDYKGALNKYMTSIGENWYRLVIPMNDFNAAWGTYSTAQITRVHIDYTGDPYACSSGTQIGFARVGFAQSCEDPAEAEMLGMSIRCTDPSGIRFGARFSTTSMTLTNAGSADANFGIILVSEANYAKNIDMTFDEAIATEGNGACYGIKIPAEKVMEIDDGYEVYAVLSDIDPANYKDNIVAIPYVDDQFAGKPVIRSVYGVAQCVVNDTTANPAHQTFCQGLIGAADNVQ